MLAKLVGINGENVHHIQDVTKAKVWINREAGQPTAIEISADSRDSLNHAKQLANDHHAASSHSFIATATAITTPSSLSTEEL